MLKAIKNGKIITPQPNTKGLCPVCYKEVISKCGEFNIWHFAHKNLKDCDIWSEGETVWHKKWKETVPLKNREVVVGKHRADIKLDNGLVIELQNSPISLYELNEREIYYENMIWIVNCTELWDKITINPMFGKDRGKWSIIWKWKKKVYLYSSKRVFLDLGGNRGLFELKSYGDRRGFGYLYSYDIFCKVFNLRNIYFRI